MLTRHRFISVYTTASTNRWAASESLTLFHQFLFVYFLFTFSWLLAAVQLQDAEISQAGKADLFSCWRFWRQILLHITRHFIETDDVVHQLCGNDDFIEHWNAPPDQPSVATLWHHRQATVMAVLHDGGHFFSCFGAQQDLTWSWNIQQDYARMHTHKQNTPESFTRTCKLHNT